ncbi:MAG: FAD-binding oxidoreductase [Pedosphaera sp.]|nr:FAD-binding oxidoreductase [Pedosphaera sp.]
MPLRFDSRAHPAEAEHLHFSIVSTDAAEYAPPVPPVFQPSNLAELTARLTAAHGSGQQIDACNLDRLSRIIEYQPEDMVVTVETGITIEALQNHLSQAKQWLPIDPPLPQATTIADVLHDNLSGPRRLAHGTIRDWALGMRVALPDGTLIRCGGKVVKNVAGYDLARLFIGSQGSLGIIVEATFKLTPLPERETFVRRGFASLREAVEAAGTLREINLNFVALDLHNIRTAPHAAAEPFTLVLGFAGANEDVAFGLDRAGELGFVEPGDLSYEHAFHAATGAEPLHKLSILPSRLGEALQPLDGVQFVARAGNGIIYYRGGPKPPKQDLPRHLFERVKQTFDPKRVLPDLQA